MIEKYALIKAIKTLISAPKNYSVRELAKKANIGVTTAKYCLDYLYSKKIIKREVIGKTYQCSLNDNFLTKHIKILFSLTQISGSGLIEELLNSYSEIISIVLYGSVARGEYDPKS